MLGKSLTRTAATIAAALTVMACGGSPEDDFACLARETLKKELQGLTGSKKIKVEQISVTDSCWTCPTIYDNDELWNLQERIDELSRWDETKSDDDFLSDIEEIRRLTARMNLITNTDRSHWGYRALVIFNKGTKKDTVNCEVSKDGLTVRALKQGTESIMGNETEIKMKELIELCEKF